jgi:peptidoglycan/LPS O-acetylase OafA/YrhL
MAAISYPLYVVHAVLGYFLLSLLAAHGVPPWLDLLIVTAVAIGCAWLIHVTVETPTHQVGKRWARRLSDPRGPSEGESSA